MSLKVRCPACDSGFVIDASFAGEELACPNCFSPVPVQPGGPPAAQASAPAPGRPSGVVPTEVATPSAQAATAAATAAAPAPAPQEEPQQVVCPRCQLHFVPKASHARVAARHDRRKRILIVEDQAFFKEIAREALSGNYEVVFAESNLEARAALTRGGIDLLVLDLNLENGDQGIELLRGMSLKPCPILIYTSRDENEMYGEKWEELKSLGADDVVMKNMKVDESLLQKVATALGDPLPDDEE